MTAGRWSDGDDQELELEGLGTPVSLVGRRVTVQTMWGQEGGTVVGVKPGDHQLFPLAAIDMDNGDRVYINVARCTIEDEA